MGAEQAKRQPIAPTTALEIAGTIALGMRKAEMQGMLAHREGILGTVARGHARHACCHAVKAAQACTQHFAQTPMVWEIVGQTAQAGGKVGREAALAIRSAQTPRFLRL